MTCLDTKSEKSIIYELTIDKDGINCQIPGFRDQWKTLPPDFDKFILKNDTK